MEGMGKPGSSGSFVENQAVKGRGAESQRSDADEYYNWANF